MIRRCVCLSAIVVCAAGSPSADAHEFEPHLLVLTAEGDGRFLVSSRWAQGRPAPVIDVPKACRLSLPILACDGNAQIRVNGLAPGDAGLLVRVVGPKGEVKERFVTSTQPTVLLSAAERNAVDGLGYLWLGIEHVWAGIDHLLFLLMLLLLVGPPSQLVAAVSAFTLGHSVTLATSMLGGQLPGPPVEAAIALSVVLLARDVVRGRSADLGRHLVGMSAIFGLVHGLGFAGALQSIGVPPSSRMTALLAFNVGIEIGQLSFVMAARLAGRALARLNPSFAGSNRGPKLAGTATGIVAMTWFIARIQMLGTGG